MRKRTTYVVHVRTAHEYARTPTRHCQYGWTKSTNIKTFKYDGDLVLYRRGRGGGSSHLTRSPESDPNARGRVRGIALFSVQMKNHHTSRREQIAMQLNQVANQFRLCGAKLLCMQFLKSKLFPEMRVYLIVRDFPVECNLGMTLQIAPQI